MINQTIEPPSAVHLIMNFLVKISREFSDEKFLSRIKYFEQ